MPGFLLVLIHHGEPSPMLRWRLLMSAILIPAVIGLFALDHVLGRTAMVLFAFCLLAAIRCVFEMQELLSARDLRPRAAACYVLSLLIVASGWMHVVWNPPQVPPVSLLVSLGWIGDAFAMAFVVMLLIEAAMFREPGRSMETLGSGLITVCYSGLLLAMTAQLRWFPSPETGYFALASMVICVKCGDTFAYTFGRLWGQRKMVPRLSPGKTWMGFVGAIAGSTVGGFLWLNYGGSLFAARPEPASLAIVIAYSASMGLVGLIGDLCESLVKRDVGRKDAPALLPGFGGLLDLFDSPLFAGPFALAWWNLLPPAAVG
jgi:phosphatidate cytidylyltransferase